MRRRSQGIIKAMCSPFGESVKSVIAGFLKKSVRGITLGSGFLAADSAQPPATDTSENSETMMNNFLLNISNSPFPYLISFPDSPNFRGGRRGLAEQDDREHLPSSERNGSREREID